jgi:hypothetical protein
MGLQQIIKIWKIMYGMEKQEEKNIQNEGKSIES